MKSKRKLKEDNQGNIFNFQKIWEKNKAVVVFALVGLILVSIGVLTLLLVYQKEPEIEIISSEQSEEKIFVYLEGAIEKPGVYELPLETRLNDLLVRAGGLAANADREWVSQNLNLAQKLTDGAKIYLPFQGEETKEEDKSAKININKASSSQLDTLWGIGEKRATDIIKNRPYQSVEELLSKKIIPQNVYEEIKDEITVY
ncbi:helix-hairpin-helix domain-containing protein [Patescibacteria group bacterium]|nr:helix-hairpin-helix domain-containing protein [Patescibacteria group bacterium]